MLEVCSKEHLITNTPNNFINDIKNFRNYVHPGRELREKVFELDKTTVELSFTIVNWLIQTIDFSN